MTDKRFFILLFSSYSVIQNGHEPWQVIDGQWLLPKDYNNKTTWNSETRPAGLRDRNRINHNRSTSTLSSSNISQLVLLDSSSIFFSLQTNEPCAPYLDNEEPIASWLAIWFPAKLDVATLMLRYDWINRTWKLRQISAYDLYSGMYQNWIEEEREPSKTNTKKGGRAKAPNWILWDVDN